MKKQLARPKFVTGSRVKYHRLTWIVGNIMEDPAGELVYHLYRFGKNGYEDDYVPERFL